ncbi:MarR family transcriptional regulator [Rhodococcus sp. D2-41]|uniref:MarR family transcriptional regulator n=1 Tax=Speluncibacter jeojiensis TaxID=2710754 RepID=A0A9X4RGJ5_9ACTN|nr:MarR family transcriptional regulator [Rhodococcus sp. D2-41]MDG3010356.1 MarR family transcriptional regulator [Rhodococcus sp. D2-41]MDG3014091.1 MarR family transcriptional regulator [Corynebacteriales bacterium D3-21]
MNARTVSPVDDDALAASWHEVMGRYHRLTCALDRALGSAHGLSSSEFDVLEQLYTHDEPKMKMATLAELVHLSQSALSRLVSRLEKDGLLARNVCTTDRRAMWTSLTDAGRRRYEEARPTHRSTLRADVAVCTADAAFTCDGR